MTLSELVDHSIEAAGDSYVSGTPAGPGAGRLRRLAPLVLLAIAVGCWTLSLLHADPLQSTNFGLLRVMGPLFVVAIVAVCGAFGVEFTGPSRAWVLVLATAVLVALLRATAPLILHPAEYAWTYKHFGITNALSSAGRVDDPHDIYQLWPGFFALIGQVSSSAGIDPERVGTWSSFVFCLIDGLILFELLRLAKANRRTGLLAVFAFEIAMWPDTNYFSPQAFTFALTLGFWCLVLRFCVRAPEPGARSRNRLARKVSSFAVVAWPRPVNIRGAGAVLPLLAICLVFFAITASHQLTPYMLILGVGGLTIFDLVRPRWLVLVLAAIGIGFFIPNAHEVTSQYTIFNGLNIFANASGNAVHTKGSTGEFISALAARGLTFLVWGGAAIVVIRRRRQPEAVLLPLILALAPFGILVAGNYGGEAIYRVILFSLPWFVLLIADEITRELPRRQRPRRLVASGSRSGWIALTVVTSVLALTSTEASQGEWSVFAVSQPEVRASEYFYAHAPLGASLSLLVQDFPTRLSGAYTHINEGLTTDPALVDEDHRLADHAWNATVVPEVGRDVVRYSGTAHFLVVSTRMKAYLSYLGIRTPSAIDSLERALDQSPQWSVWYRNADTTIYRLHNGSGG